MVQRHEVDVSSLRQWIAGYPAHAEAGVAKKKRAFYSVEFKLSVLKRMREEELPHRQTAAAFNVRHFNPMPMRVVLASPYASAIRSRTRGANYHARNVAHMATRTRNNSASGLPDTARCDSIVLFSSFPVLRLRPAMRVFLFPVPLRRRHAMRAAAAARAIRTDRPGINLLRYIAAAPLSLARHSH